MRKTALTVLTSLAVYGTIQAQTTLENGTPGIHQLVTRPFFYYDLMRSENPSWKTEVRETTATPWAKWSKVVQQKDALGRFVNLEAYEWNSTTQEWDTTYHHRYDRLTSNGNITREAKTSWQRENNDSLRPTATVINSIYENDTLRGAQTVVATRNITVTLNTKYTYNEQGQRIHDSDVVQNTGQLFTSKYLYNNEGLCTGYYTTVGSDTNSHIEFGYNGDTLVRYSVYSYFTGTPELVVNEAYTYNAAGLIETVTHAGMDENNIFGLLNRYQHGYTAAGKLKWMARFTREGSEWHKADSIVLAFNGNETDTSYGYISQDGTDWDTEASMRFTFTEEQEPVGLNEHKNTLAFSLYPNPARGVLYIGTEKAATIDRVSISDLTGRQLAVHTQVSGSIDVSALKAGIYLVQVQSGQQSAVKKLVIN